jgi:hypothetical protein
MSFLKKFAVISLAAFLTGCGSLPFNITPDHQLDAGTGTGVAVFSVSEACPSKMSLKIKSESSVFDEAIAIDQSQALRSAPLQWQNPCGRVVMRELAAGSYRIFSFVLIGPVRGVTYLAPTQEIAIPFAVTAGKATYIGHLNFDISLPKRTYRLSLEDRRERDIPILKSHAKSIGDQDILFQIPDVQIAQTEQELRAVRVVVEVAR